MNVLDVINVRLDQAVKDERLEAGMAEIAKHSMKVIFEHDTESLLDVLESAIWGDKTDYELNRPDREGVDNDGLTDAEATEALDE